jgi:hypothetical protein
MAITYIQTPKSWSPINNDLIYYAKTNSAVSNIYLKVFVQSSVVATVKLVVNSGGFAYCDVRQFLQSFTKNDQMYFDNTFWKALTGQSYYVGYQVKMYETLGGTSYDDAVRYAFNGQIPFIDFVEYDQQYNTELSPAGKFLTYSPRTLKTDFLRTNFLSYINGTEPATKIRLRTYESGATTPTRVYELDIDDLTALAGIIAISKEAIGGDLVLWEDVSDLWEDLSTQTWDEIGGYLINPDVTQIDICLLNVDLDIVSEIFTYKYYDYCSKYQKTNIYWQNSLGGFDSYTFNMVKRKRYDIDRKSIQSYPYEFNNTGYSQHTNNIFNLSSQNYFSNYTEGISLNSDILTNEDHIWMWELIKAHSIYVEQVINGVTYYIPATIKATNYEPKDAKVDGLQNIIIDLAFGYDNIKITK